MTGLPTRNVTQAVASLVLWEAPLTTAGIVIAALAGLALAQPAPPAARGGRDRARGGPSRR
ncbi:MAG: hypothetical protein R2734_14780 [Nocardioides sp.]